MAYDPHQPRDEKGRWTSYSFRQNASYSEITKYEKDIIKSPDTQPARSAGTSWRNEKILLADGTEGKFLDGAILQNKEVFAGKGVKRKIDDIQRLLIVYPGTKEDEWMKLKALTEVVFPSGEIEKLEIHWYEYPGKGKFEFKEKNK